MQDKSLSSDARATIAVVSTFPKENWKWRGNHLRSLLGWGRERFQKTMRELKTRKFVTVRKVSNGHSIHAEYLWDIDASVRRSENPTNGEPVRRVARPHNDVVRSNEEVKSKETQGEEQGSAERSRISQRKSKAGTSRAPRSSREPVPEYWWQKLLDYISEIQHIEWRSTKRDRGALRSLWAMLPYEDDDARFEMIIDALDRAASGEESAEKLFAVATQFLEHYHDGTRSRSRSRHVA
jgi:hypothetical protein